MRRQFVTSSVISLAALATLSGCGNGEPPAANDLVADVKKNATSAKSTHVLVSGDVNGVRTTMDVSGTLDGTNQRQIQTQKSARNEGFIVDKTGYLKGNSAFWTALGASEANAKKLQDAWWKADAAQSNPAFDVKGMLNTFFSSADGKALSSKDASVTESTTNGQETYTIKPKDSSKASIIVTRGKKPQLVQITGYASDLTKTKATYDFSEWNKVKHFEPPKGAKPITQAGLTN